MKKSHMFFSNLAVHCKRRRNFFTIICVEGLLMHVAKIANNKIVFTATIFSNEDRNFFSLY